MSAKKVLMFCPEPLHGLFQVWKAVEEQARQSGGSRREDGGAQGVCAVWGQCHLHPPQLWQVLRLSDFDVHSICDRIFSHFENKKANQNSMEQHRQVAKMFTRATLKIIVL